MNDAAKYLATMIDTDERDHALAVSEAHGWTEPKLDALPATREGEQLFMLLFKLRQEPEQSGLRLQRLMREALVVQGDGMDLLNPYEDMTAPPPAWPSTLGDVDFRGLVVIAGNAKLGKSSICIASALEAALAGAFVVYANAELDAPTFRSYIRRWMPDRDVREAALENFRAFMVNPGISCESMVANAMGAVDRNADRVLFVLDSINTVANLSGSNYLRELERLTLWSMQVRKISNGEVGALVVSEKNKGGGPIGAKLNYAADVILNMSRGKTDGYVGFDLTSRYQRSGDLGSMLFDWQGGRFLGERALPEASADGTF
jgi:hypothetical protein